MPSLLLASKHEKPRCGKQRGLIGSLNRHSALEGQSSTAAAYGGNAWEEAASKVTLAWAEALSRPPVKFNSKNFCAQFLYGSFLSLYIGIFKNKFGIIISNFLVVIFIKHLLMQLIVSIFCKIL